MNARIPAYSGPTANPCADAEAWNDQQEAADDFQQKAATRAPYLLLRQLQAIKKPADWLDPQRILGRFSAEEILRDALGDSDDDVADRYAEFMIDATPEAKEKLLKAMAEWFSSVYAFEVYTEWLEDIQDTR
jgi:hypothetical protein